MQPTPISTHTFYITHPYARPCDVYRIFAKDGLLLYIGSTCALEERLIAHKHAPWFHLAHKVEVEEFATLEEARAVESAAIRDEQPAANVAGRGFYPGKGPKPLDPRLIERGVKEPLTHVNMERNSQVTGGLDWDLAFRIAAGYPR